MKYRMPVFLTVLIAASAVAACWVVSGSGAGMTFPTSHASQSDKPGSLKRKARMEAGSITEKQQVNFGSTYGNLAALVRDSSVVVVGTPVFNYGRLTSDETSVTTNYSVQVEEVIKGPVRQGTSITVLSPGGVVVFEDKTAVQVVPVGGFKRILNNQKYVLFLTSSDGKGNYSLVGGPQGAFNISSSDLGAQPCDMRQNGGVAQKYRGVSPDAFLADVRQAAR
jgi:hypothetical protein